MVKSFKSLSVGGPQSLLVGFHLGIVRRPVVDQKPQLTAGTKVRLLHMGMVSCLGSVRILLRTGRFSQVPYLPGVFLSGAQLESSSPHLFSGCVYRSRPKPNFQVFLFLLGVYQKLDFMSLGASPSCLKATRLFGESHRINHDLEIRPKRSHSFCRSRAANIR